MSEFGIFENYETRQMQTLDQLVGEDAQFDLIKQDVQGAEIMVMQGAPDIFARAQYVIQEVNLHKDKQFPEMPSENEMDEYMFQLGFNNTEVIERKENVDCMGKYCTHIQSSTAGDIIPMVWSRYDGLPALHKAILGLQP